jgi:hypothetical protein
MGSLLPNISCKRKSGRVIGIRIAKSKGGVSTSWRELGFHKYNAKAIQRSTKAYGKIGSEFPRSK